MVPFYREWLFDRYRKIPVLSVPVLWMMIGLVAVSICANWAAPHSSDLRSDVWYTVDRVIDGDTVMLKTGHRLRLQGVNTPETKHPQLEAQPGGKQATQFTTHWIGSEPIQLEFDREKRDHYGRYLVYVLRDQQCLNTDLIRAGWSKAQLRLPINGSKKKEFVRAETEARESQAGLWNIAQFPNGFSESE